MKAIEQEHTELTENLFSVSSVASCSTQKTKTMKHTILKTLSLAVVMAALPALAQDVPAPKEGK